MHFRKKKKHHARISIFFCTKIKLPIPFFHELFKVLLLFFSQEVDNLLGKIKLSDKHPIQEQWEPYFMNVIHIGWNNWGMHWARQGTQEGRKWGRMQQKSWNSFQDKRAGWNKGKQMSNNMISWEAESPNRYPTLYKVEDVWYRIEEHVA